MDWPTSAKRDCATLVLLILIFGAIYYFAFRESGETTPSPSEGYLPPR